MSEDVTAYNEYANKYHVINFAKEYGTLFDLLTDMMKGDMSINPANLNRKFFLLNLMQGYDKNDLLGKESGWYIFLGKLNKFLLNRVIAEIRSLIY